MRKNPEKSMSVCECASLLLSDGFWEGIEREEVCVCVRSACRLTLTFTKYPGLPLIPVHGCALECNRAH